MKDWFFGLDKREQVSVLVGGVFVVFAVLYFSIWAPLDRGQKSLEASVSTWERSLAELRPLKAALRAAASGRPAQVQAGQSLVVIVDRTLRERSLYTALQSSQPTSANGIRVEFKDVSFDDTIRWLGDLSGRYGMQVQSGSFSISAQNVPGRVNVSLTLER